MKKKNEAQNKLTGDRIKESLSRIHMTQASFVRVVNDSGHPIDKATLSNLISGKTTLSPDRAQAFSKILNVSASYLLGLVTFDNSEEEAKHRDIISSWSEKDHQAIQTFKRILDCLTKEHELCFDAYEIAGKKKITRKIIYTSNSIDIYSPETGSSQNISQEEFFNWVCSPEAIVLIKSDIKKGDRRIHLNDRVILVKKKDMNEVLELNLNSFVKMIYDINFSITDTINSRIGYWFNYSSFDYKSSFIRDYEDYEI